MMLNERLQMITSKIVAKATCANPTVELTVGLPFMYARVIESCATVPLAPTPSNAMTIGRENLPSSNNVGNAGIIIVKVIRLATNVKCATIVVG